MATLAYGNSDISFPVPDNCEKLIFNEPEFSVHKEKFQASLQDLLHQLNFIPEDLAIVVSDKTRLCGYEIYLPWLLETLLRNKIKKENITFFIAYGTHPRQSDEECICTYGDLYRHYRFVHHDCVNADLFHTLGVTSRGTPITIRKDLLQKDMIITMGAISHHYFAGFGGGRKLIFPGLGEKQAIYANHSLFLNPETRKLSHYCQPGVLKYNPVAEDLLEINRRMPFHFEIHGIMDSHGQVKQFMFGTGYDDFLNACLQHDKYYKVYNNKQYDLVLASTGGYPKDINFIQSHKSVHNAAAFVKDGGQLILLAECRDGIGTSTFLPVFDKGGWDKTFDLLLKNYAGNGGTALSMMAKTMRINILMMTRLDDNICNTIDVTKVDRLQTVNIIEQTKGTMAVIENASMLVKGSETVNNEQ